MINLHEPNISKKDIDSVKKVLADGWVSSAGKEINKFENRLKDYTGSKYVVACVNGTSALHIAIKLLNLNNYSEVLVPSLTFIASVNSIIYNNLSPFFIDNDKYYTADTGKVLKFLTNNTKITKKNNKYYLINKISSKIIRAILIIHVFGNAADIEKILKICKKYNIYIVEDAAESLGTFYTKNSLKGKHTGTIGDIGCLSFNGNKIITTGSGGAILLKNKKHEELARYYINQSKDDNMFYIHKNVGYNYRMNNIEAALGLSQLNRINNILKNKIRIHKTYKKYFKNNINISISNSPDYCKSNYWLNILEINIQFNKINLHQLIKYLIKNNIQVRPLWYPNHLQRPFLKFNKDKISFLKKIYNNRLCLPSSYTLSEKDIKFISQKINKFVTKKKSK